MTARPLLAAVTLACLTFASRTLAQPAPQIVLQNTPQLWQRAEFKVLNVPAATNPFAPESITVDAVFRSPSMSYLVVPGFWYQAYTRNLSGGYESLSISGSPEWRVRFTPREPGLYSVWVTVRTNAQVYATSATTTFTVPTNSPPQGSGYVGLATNHQYFQTSDGTPLRLIGENVGWPGGRGTYDYDDWFTAMQAAGENFARVWMCPWAFGLETDPNSLTNYRLDRAWQLDYVLQVAEQKGIRILLCLDYHGMFEVVPDYWGGNNYWTNNPYNVINGGPCVNQDAFFTNSLAQTIYQKRLRYLIARYGYSPNLLTWEFFNEIDNVYAYLNPADVAAWHGSMGTWLHNNDPFGHLVTTSLTGSSDRPEIWTLPQLDFACYHSYGEPAPARRLAQVGQSFQSRYSKPVMIEEFGTDWRGWNRTNDPYLRGFRQGLWGGALGGSVGTSMSWWWENVQSENVYPVFSSLAGILNRTGWGRGSASAIGFKTSGTSPPTVGDLIPGGVPFDAFLTLSGVWGGMPSGQLALPNPAAAGYSANALNSFVHGIWHSDLKTPFQLSAWLTNNARLMLHLNSVSDGSIMVVLANGVELFRTNLPNLDGGYSVNNEYNLDLPVDLPAGKSLIEVTNAGTDWFYLDWVSLQGVLPSTYAGNWQPTPDAIGLRGQHESLLYVVAPGASFPGSATNTLLPLQQGQTIVLTNWPAGTFFAEWYDPLAGSLIATSRAVATNSTLTLELPDFREDLAGVVYPPPVLTALGMDQGFHFCFNSETGGRYEIQKSGDLKAWSTFLNLTNVEATAYLIDPSAPTNSRNFFRAQHSP